MHTHGGVEPADGTTGPPGQPIAPTWTVQALTCRSQVVKLDLAPSPDPTYQEDPDA